MICDITLTCVDIDYRANDWISPPWIGILSTTCLILYAAGAGLFLGNDLSHTWPSISPLAFLVSRGSHAYFAIAARSANCWQIWQCETGHF